MEDEKSHSASIKLLNDTVWWITGGRNDRMWFKTTEMMKIEKGNIVEKVNTTTLPPELPDLKHGHCMARIDSNRVFMAGGNSKYGWIYNELFNNFTKLPDLRRQRYTPACSTVTINNTIMLMVVGGIDNLAINKGYVVEMYNMTDCNKPLMACTGKWLYDDGMLEGIGKYIDGAYVTYNDGRGLILTGGHFDIHPDKDLSNKLVNFNESNNSFIKLQQTMRHRRQGHSAVLIPDGDIECP